jgi:hypothetical protein
MTIYNTSSDPVLLKKIPLRIWKLREEVESIIQSRYEKATDKEKGVQIEDLAKEYATTTGHEKIDAEKKLQPEVIIPVEKISFGKAIISEINMEGIRFFCSSSYIIGNSLVVEFQIPKHFRLNAVVVNNKEYDLKSKLISKKKLPYRLFLQWTFLKPGERTLLRDFLQSISLNKNQGKGDIVTQEIKSPEEKKTA